MHRTITALALAAASMALTSVSSAATPGTPATLYFHGGPNGNVATGQAVVAGGTGFLPMDRDRPTSGLDSDFGFGSIAGQPDPTCVGDPQAMVPTWTGAFTGTLVRKVQINAFSRSLPGGGVTVRLFADLPGKALCGSAAKPFATATGHLAESPLSIPFTATAVLSKAVVVKKSLTIEFMPSPTLVPFQGSSIAFDSTTSPSSVTFFCLPKRGKKTC